MTVLLLSMVSVPEPETAPDKVILRTVFAAGPFESAMLTNEAAVTETAPLNVWLLPPPESVPPESVIG